MKFSRQGFRYPALLSLVLGATVFGQTVAPKVINNPDPVYPPEAAEMALGGSVVVVVKVDKQGSVSVQGASGPIAHCSKLEDKRVDKIQKAVIEAVKQSSFEPSMKDGKPIETELKITYRFDESGRPYHGPPASIKMVESGGLQGRVKFLARPNLMAARGRGLVPVNVLVDLDGRVIAAGAVGGPSQLRFEAEKAACKSRFEPTVLKGNPVMVSGVLTYIF